MIQHGYITYLATQAFYFAVMALSFGPAWLVNYAIVQRKLLTWLVRKERVDTVEAHSCVDNSEIH